MFLVFCRFVEPDARKPDDPTMDMRSLLMILWFVFCASGVVGARSVESGALPDRNRFGDGRPCL
jgi:hypothetical protein